ncbi:MAG: hypothetical protein DRI91_01155, partial [Aquificota bacterium]
LGKEHMKAIVDLLIDRLRKRLAHRKIDIELTQAVKEFLVEVGFDPQYGARPLRRAVQKYIENPLAQLILKGEVRPGHKVVVEMEEGQIRFKPQEMLEEEVLEAEVV